MTGSATPVPPPVPTHQARMGTIAHLVDGVRARPVASHLTLMGTLAFSAGVHAGLVAAHIRESPVLGASFVASVFLLTGIALALAVYPASTWPPRAAAASYFALILAYFTFTERIVDPLGLTTKAVEAFGLVLALLMRPPPELQADRRTFVPVYLLLVGFTVLVALDASGHHQH